MFSMKIMYQILGLVHLILSKPIYLREVHKIGILDIRIVNCDRNEENILVRKYYLYKRIYLDKDDLLPG